MTEDLMLGLKTIAMKMIGVKSTEHTSGVIAVRGRESSQRPQYKQKLPYFNF